MIDNHITYQGDRHIDDMRAAFEHRARVVCTAD